MFKLYYFSSDNGESEFVIVSDQPEDSVREEHEDGDVSLMQSFELKGDATSLPTDRPLVKE